MRRTLTTLTALAMLAAPAAFAADAMMKKDEPAMMKKEDTMMKADAPAMMAKRPALSAYVTSRLDALADKIATGSRKEANIAWLKSGLAKAAPGSRQAATYAYLLEKIEWYGKDAMMKPEEGAMMKKGEPSMMKAPDAMMKKEEPSMMKKPDAMMKKDGGAMMAAGTYAAYDADAVKAAQAAGKTPVLFFAASWCPNCRALDAAIQAHATEIPSSVAVFKVDYDASDDLKKAYGVRMQHTLVALRADGTFSLAAGTVTDVAGIKNLAETK